MLKHTTRSTVFQLWFCATALIVASAIALGVEMTVGTGAMLIAFCLVPPAILLMLWPGVRPTVAEVLHDVERRP